ncbi:MAG: hypothetical protein GF372_03575 [Candidatus Marinimicrobia bacterium]|nr:hypothetical protein [Candidatus Neomarinimicrobiota bacterium]
MVMPLWHRLADYSPTLRSVESAEISPDGRHVISASKFGYHLMLWRAADGHLIWEKILDAEIEAVTFSPDGKYIVAGDEAYNVTVYDLEGTLIRELDHDAAFDGITWSPDGKYIAGGSEGGEVVLWNTETWEKERILKAGNTVNSLEFTKDVTKLIAAGNRYDEGTDSGERHGFVKAWDISNNWNVLIDLKAQKRSTKSVRLSPDETRFSIAGFANQVKVYSFPEAEELAVIDVPERLEAIAYHPEGNFIFVGGHGEEMRVYHTDTYTQVHTFPCRRVEYIHFSQDGRLMATGHEDSGLLTLYLLHSKVQSSEDYDQLSREILENKDLD